MAQESWKREQEAGCQQPDGPIRCAKNCGFFGSAATMNMCSKCYRDHVLQQTKEAAQASAAAAAKASQHLMAVSRTDLMDVDSNSNAKEREATDNDFMSGVHVLAGMAAEEKASSASAMMLDSHGQTSSSASSPLPDSKTSASSSSLASQPTSASAAASSLPSTSPAMPTPAAASGPNRCATCKRKVGLTGFKCRCNSVFCSMHRYSDKHDCSFDYKAAARDAIAKANPVVRGSKIEKI